MTDLSTPADALIEGLPDLVVVVRATASSFSGGAAARRARPAGRARNHRPAARGRLVATGAASSGSHAQGDRSRTTAEARFEEGVRL